MKTRYNALHSVAMMLGLLLVGGVTGAWADLKKSEMGNDVCSPVIHFKLPDGWTNAYLMISGQGLSFPNPKLADDGWTSIDLGATKANDDVYFFINGVNKNDCNDGMCVTRNGVNVKPNNARVEGFKCTDVGTEGEIWIMEHPDSKKQGQVYVTTSKPVIKDFYVFLPDNKTWKSSSALIEEDGKPHEMNVDSKHCGWYYRRYILDGKIDKALPSSVIIYREDDADKNGAIGKGGEKALEEGLAAEPIELATYFELFAQDPKYHDALYFVADQKQAEALPSDEPGWYAEQPGITGDCSYNLAAVIYDTDAQLHPLFSCYADGARSGNDGCQESAKSQDAIYDCIGVRQGLVESKLTIENGKKKMKLTTAGNHCFLDQKTFDQMFNMTQGVNEMSCYDMKFERAPDGKWEFDSDYSTSDGLKVQGGFYPVETTTDADILKADASQTPAPKARTKRFAEGPVFYGPLLRANDPTEQIPKIDVYCAGPGWPKKAGVAYDCEGLFADGDGTTARINSDLKIGTMNQDACVFGWSCDDRGNAPADWPFYTSGTETKVTTQGTGRWQSKENTAGTGGRNQHFCFESHANFRFKKNLKFNFRGDDDIWVFIDNKLAVDLGGTHLAAPGYVDLDYFMKTNGYNLDSIVGTSFDIDIFFCDRRTTMSNVRIKTNMFIEQTTGITADGKQKEFIADYMENGNNHYKICYKKSGNGSCSALVLGGAGEEEKCGKEITEKITFVLTKDKTGADPDKAYISEDAFMANPKQGCNKEGICGVDVTTPGLPIVNEEQLATVLPSGKYYLVIKIGGDTKAIDINIKGSAAVANREAVAVDEDGVKGFLHEFRNQAMASLPDDNGEPDVKQMIPLYVASLIDPCMVEGCTDPLEMTNGARNTSYSLVVSNKKAQFYKMKDNKLVSFNPDAGTTIGDSGIDTIYVTIPFDEMENAVEPVSVNVRGNNSKADLTFFVPRLAFVDSDSTFKVVTRDDDNPKDKDIRLKGSAYEFYIVALKGDDSPCGELCNFKLTRGSRFSSGVNIIAGGEVVNGRATITIQSQKVYEKCDNPDRSKCGKDTTATIHVVGPNAALTFAEYTNLQFQEPPVPTPLFADIFDVHGEPSVSALNINAPYYDAAKEYLDGIADSLVVYYGKPFKNHKDSLPDSILVSWMVNDKDSVRKFDGDVIRRGAICGADSGFGATIDPSRVDAEHCLGKITLGGKKLSNDVKTFGTGKVVSWASFTARGVSAVKDYSAVIIDRIAPIIISAKAKADTASGQPARLTVKFSEPVAKTDLGVQEGDKNVFSYFINATQNHHYVDSLPVAAGTASNKLIDTTHTFIFGTKSEFPQAGDYIHFRGLNGVGLVEDQASSDSTAVIAIREMGADTLRNETGVSWNIAPAYNVAAPRVPSPWVLITGDVNSYAERLIPSAYGSIPLTPSEAATLPSTEVISFDAYKDENEFKQAMLDKNVAVSPALDKYGFVTHGWFIKSDMGALIAADTITQKAIGSDYKKVYLNYEIQLFSNLGNHVLTKKGRIYCADSENKEVDQNGKRIQYFEGSNCVDKPRNFFILWNMKDDNGRLVGSGAYVSKMKSSVKLEGVGTKNKFDKTEMWGVRHNTSVNGNVFTVKTN